MVKLRPHFSSSHFHCVHDRWTQGESASTVKNEQRGVSHSKWDECKESDVKVIRVWFETDTVAFVSTKHWTHPAPLLALNAMHGNDFHQLLTSAGKEKTDSMARNQQMSVLYFSMRNERGRVWDKTLWVSLQCNAEQSTVLTPNLSHSALSSSPLGTRQSQEENKNHRCSYTSADRHGLTQR